MSTSTTPRGGQYNGSLHFSLLPFIEQEGLFRTGLGLQSTTQATWGTGVVNFPLKVFQCPSDTTMSDGVAANDASSGWTHTSYQANAALFGNLVSPLNMGVPVANSGDASTFTIGEIPDGSSNTMTFVCSYAGRPTPPTSPTGTPIDASARWAYPGPGFTVGTFTGDGRAYNASFGWGVSVRGAYGNSANLPAFSVGPYQATDRSQVYATHGVVIMVAMADGSAKTISSGVGQQTWQYAINPSDGATLGPDWD
jgi:hypothetical protein